MELLIIPALIILLVVLVVARSAQRDTRRDESVASAQSSAHSGPRSTADRSPTIETHAAQVDRPEIDFFEWECMQIARRGETRAGSLDFFGYLVLVVAGLTAIGTAAALIGGDEGMSSAEQAIIAFGGLGTFLGLAAMAALLLGFSALVRNSSRGLVVLLRHRP